MTSFDEIGVRSRIMFSLVGVFRLFVSLLLLKLLWELPPWKLLRLEVLLLPLSRDGFGLAIGYLQNSCPNNANEDNCCLFLASLIALGKFNCTGNSSLKEKIFN